MITNLQRGEKYKINYKGYQMEGIYLGGIKKRLKNQHIILLNISPESKRMPIHFPVLFVRDLKVQEGELIYSKSERGSQKIKISELEQKTFNDLGRKYWE